MGDSLTRRDLLKIGSVGLVAGLAPARVWAQAGEAKRLRCGFVGVGGRGTLLLRAVLDLKDVDVVALCDTDPGNLQRGCDLVEKAQGRRPEALGEGPEQYRDLLKGDRVDCLVIATPCHWHAMMYVDALNAGRHFYGEKPMAITAGEVSRVLEARKAHRDVVVQIGFQWGANQARADAIRQVREGAIGDLVEGRFYRYNNWTSLGRWFNKRELSGDWMLEQATHEFNLMWWVTGEHPVAAYAVGRRGIVEPENAERDVTDYYTAILEYPRGLIVHYSHGWISPPGYTGMCTQFIGTKGAVDVLGCSLQVQGQKEPVKGQGPGGDTPEHLRNFFDAVRQADPGKVFCGTENGEAASCVGLLIRKSLELKRRVTFDEAMRERERPRKQPWNFPNY